MKKLIINVLGTDFQDLKDVLEGVSQQLALKTTNDIMEYDDKSGYSFEVREADPEDTVYSI